MPDVGASPASAPSGMPSGVTLDLERMPSTLRRVNLASSSDIAPDEVPMRAGREVERRLTGLLRACQSEQPAQSASAATSAISMAGDPTADAWGMLVSLNPAHHDSVGARGRPRRLRRD